jgi:hypothetical protein
MSAIKRVRLQLFFCLLVIYGGAYSLFGQEESAVTPPESTVQDDSNTVYYIKAANFTRSGHRIRTGLSQPFALLRRGDIRIGERIIGRDKLEEYRLDRTQFLMNQRVLDQAHISLIFEEPEADGSVPVILDITTVDTATIIVLPQPRFDDNDGFRIVLKARDYNFFGTMNPLRFDFGYEYDTLRQESSYFALIDSDSPFRLFGYTWNFNFDNYFSYTALAPFHYKNTSGLSMELPAGFTTITFGLEETIVVNEDNREAYKAEYESVKDEEGDYKELYMSTTLGAAWKIPTGLYAGKFGELTYTPEIKETFNYTPGGDIGYLRRGPLTTLSHSLGFGRLDWLDNFRSGLEASIANTNVYNSYRNNWASDLDIYVSGHTRLLDFFGISGRLRYRDWFKDEYDEAGDVLRGIRNDEFSAARILSLNLDFPFRLLNFTPSSWFNTGFLRFMDLEFHLAPIVDAALVINNDDAELSSGNLRVTAGMELIVFSHFWRNLYLRVSGGLNLRKIADAGSVSDRSLWEIFLGMEHHF